MTADLPYGGSNFCHFDDGFHHSHDRHVSTEALSCATSTAGGTRSEDDGTFDIATEDSMFNPGAGISWSLNGLTVMPECRNILVRYCAHVPRNFQYRDGIQVVRNLPPPSYPRSPTSRTASLTTLSYRCSSSFETTLEIATWALQAVFCTSLSRSTVLTQMTQALVSSVGDVTT
jgi:hypothetical protein